MRVHFSGAFKSADVSNLNSGLAVLELLGHHVDGLPLRDIANALDLSRSTAHRLLNALVVLGYVSQEGELSPYRLTMKLASIGLRYLSLAGVNRLVQPVLDRLAAQSGDLARMSLVEDDRLIWIAMAQGSKAGLRYDPISPLGEDLTLFCSSNGQAWLSCLSDEKALEIVARQGWGDPGRYGPNAPKTIKDFLDCLHRARETGYAIIHEAYALGISSVATAVRSPEGQHPIGVLSIAGPSPRLTDQRIRELAPWSRARWSAASAGRGGGTARR